MSLKVLFVASLHHPEQLQRDIESTPAGEPQPLFPTSMGQHFWERAMRRRGYTLDVFWRNLSGFGSEDVSGLSSQKYTQGLTPQRIAGAVMYRLPAQANPDYRRRNQRLLRKARAFKPDILWMIGDNTVIYHDTLAAIKQQTGCKIVYASGTSPIVFSRPVERKAARLYDLVLVNDYYHGIQWMELGAKHMECLPIAAIDPDFHKPRTLSDEERARMRCDVTFVGTLLPKTLYSERIHALESLVDFDLGIWSVHDVPETLRPYLKGVALGGEMMRVLSGSTISLNVHGDFMRYGGNMRLFESAAMGAFQIVDNRPGIKEWFTPGEHLVIYKDMIELHELVAYYLAHPDERAAIVKSAREHALQYHTYDNRLDRVSELMQSLWGMSG